MVEGVARLDYYVAFRKMEILHLQGLKGAGGYYAAPSKSEKHKQCTILLLWGGKPQDRVLTTEKQLLAPRREGMGEVEPGDGDEGSLCPDEHVMSMRDKATLLCTWN